MEINMEKIEEYLAESMKGNSPMVLIDDKNKTAYGPTITSMIFGATILKNKYGKKKAAIKICDRILKIHPDNIYALLLKAGALNELHKYDKAFAVLNQTIEDHPDNWEAYYLLAMNHFCMGYYEKALELINKSVELQEMFDNVLSKAQMLKLMKKENYQEFVENAKCIDEKRCENFMKNMWIEDIREFESSLTGKISRKTAERWNALQNESKKN